MLTPFWYAMLVLMLAFGFYSIRPTFGIVGVIYGPVLGWPDILVYKCIYSTFLSNHAGRPNVYFLICGISTRVTLI